MIIIESPHVPISVNDAYQNRKGGSGRGRIKTERYRTWAQACGYDINAAMRGQKPILGAYVMSITIDRRTRNPLSDIDNLIKTMGDLLVAHKVIEDDRFAERVSIGWGDTRSGGVRVEIEGLE